jgi:hypothetical protein
VARHPLPPINPEPEKNYIIFSCDLQQSRCCSATKESLISQTNSLLQEELMAKGLGLSVDQLRLNIKSLPIEQQNKALLLLSGMGIDITQPNNNLTGTGVVGFFLEGQHYEADSHRAVYLMVLSIILRKHPEHEEKILKIKGTKKKYFSKSAGDFKHDYTQISGTRIYTDINENAAQLNRRCQKVLQTVGIDPSSLWVMDF